MYKLLIAELLDICKQQQVILESLDTICEPCNKVNLQKSIDFKWVNENIIKAEKLLEQDPLLK